MSPFTEGVLCAAMIFLAYTLRDIDRQTREETAALQQIVKDSAAENARLEKQDERMEEILEHMAGVTKRGKK